MTDETVTVRRSREDDVHAVLCLWASSRSRHASTPDVREDIERLVEGWPAALLVAESGGHVWAR